MPIFQIMDIDNCSSLYINVDIWWGNIHLDTVAIVVSSINCRHFIVRGIIVGN